MNEGAVLAENAAIRAVAGLLGGVTLKGTPVPVFRSRIYASDPKKLPSLCVYRPATDYSHGRGTPGTRVEQADMGFHVVATFAKPQGVDNTLEDDMDEIATQVRDTLAWGFSMQNPQGIRIVSDLKLKRFRSGFAGNAASSSVIAELSYSAVIQTREGDSATAFAVR